MHQNSSKWFYLPGFSGDALKVTMSLSKIKTTYLYSDGIAICLEREQHNGV
jgi:hypothetical protein